MGSEPVGTGVESCRLSVPFVLLLWCRLCPKVRAPSDGLLLCTALNCMRQRQISVNRRKAVFCGAFRAEASEWLDEKWPLSSPEWDNEQQSESLWSSCTKKNQWDFIFVLTILIDRKEEDTVWESNKSHWQTWNRKSLANLLTVLTLHFSLILQVFSWSFAGDSLKFALTFPYNLMLGYRWGENSALDFLRALAWLCVIWKDRAEALKPYKSFLNVNVTATAVPYFVIRVLSFQR